MAKRDDLRRSRAGSIINLSSKKMETRLGQSIVRTAHTVKMAFEVDLVHHPRVYLREIVQDLRQAFPEVDFGYRFEGSFLLPDGGFLTLRDTSGREHLILVSEAKRQGTNDLRRSEGLPPQSKGNAIERLGKNLIGIRTWMSAEMIMPFVAFGEGCDFADDSYILDRVAALAMFAPLNRIEVLNVGPEGAFARGSFFFREAGWTVREMEDIQTEIATRSIHYYFAKYGEASFR